MTFWQGTEFGRDGFPSLTPHNDNIGMDIKRTRRDFLKMLDLARQIPGQKTVLTDPEIFIDGNNDGKWKAHLNSDGKFDEFIVMITGKLDIFEREIQDVFSGKL